MANHPLNLLLRFVLELMALGAFGIWGWDAHTGLARWLWTLGLPLAAAAAWGVFRVPNDPGPAPVAVPGWARLLLEAVFFGGAVWALFAAGLPSWGLGVGIVVLLHYLASYDRVLRFLRPS